MMTVIRMPLALVGSHHTCTVLFWSQYALELLQGPRHCWCIRSCLRWSYNCTSKHF